MLRSVLVCEARTDDIGYTTAKRLQDAGIPVTVIMDNAVAYFMETVDLVLLGAEGIVENGGVINKVVGVLLRIEGVRWEAIKFLLLHTSSKSLCILLLRVSSL